MKRSLRYNLVDVFTDTPLTGNPLAVFTKGQGLNATTMQRVAREMNLSETVFFLPPDQGGHARIRIFTPKRELAFAGHPVLGSAWVLGHPMEMGTVIIETAAGPIEVSLHREGGLLQSATMKQPLPSFLPFEKEEEVRDALGLNPLSEAQLPTCHADNGPTHLLVEAESREELNALTPDFGRIGLLDLTGVLVFCQNEQTCAARYFAPASGINEDPATGSACGALIAHLVSCGRVSSDAEVIVHQGEKMARPSLLLAQATLCEGAITQVKIGGSAVVIGRGELLL